MTAYIDRVRDNEEVIRAKEIVNSSLRVADEAYKLAASLAEEHGFDFDYEGPAGYGDGGYFYAESGWLASSQSC